MTDFGRPTYAASALHTEQAAAVLQDRGEEGNATRHGTTVRVPPAPPPSSATARKVMLGNRRESATERALRSALHARGERFRKDYAPAPGLRCKAETSPSGQNGSRSSSTAAFGTPVPSTDRRPRPTATTGAPSSRPTWRETAATMTSCCAPAGPSFACGSTSRPPRWPMSSSGPWASCARESNESPRPPRPGSQDGRSSAGTAGRRCRRCGFVEWGEREHHTRRLGSPNGVCARWAT